MGAVEELLEAARLMHERAKAATPGPWEAGDRYQLAGVMPEAFGAGRCNVCRRGGPIVWSGRTDINGRVMDAHEHVVEPYDHVSIVAPTPNGTHGAVVFGQGEMGPNLERADAEHIAGWPPEVALAVAEWLEMEAHMVGLRDLSAEGHSFHALKVARAYLGRAS